MRFRNTVATIAAMLGITPAAEQLVALDAALDAELDIKSAFDALSDEEKDMACDAFAKGAGKAKADLKDEEKAEAYKRAAADKKAKTSAPAVQEGNKGPHAAGMDSASVQLAIDTAVAKALEGYVTKLASDALVATAADAARAEATAQVHALYDARKAVEATVGVVAMDSAEAVFRFALDHLKVEHKDIQAPALAALYEASAKAAALPTVALDTAAAFDISSIYTKG